jgi:hypothetical protein
MKIELRDYFAAKAMPIVFKQFKENWISDGHWQYLDKDEMEMLSARAYEFANAMMKARYE